MGKPHAVNAGVLECSGSHVWIFDDDDLAEPGYLQLCVDHLEAHECDYVFGWHYAGGSQSDYAIAKEVERKPSFFCPSDVFLSLLVSCSFAHNAIVAAKHCYTRLRGMDHTYPCSEDYEFQLRLAQVFRGCYLDVPAFTRRLHEGERGSARFRYAAHERRRRFLEQDRRFIQRYLKELPLMRFACSGADVGTSTIDSQRRAFVTKFRIAAGVGLWQEAIEALERLVQDDIDDSIPLCRTEFQLLSACLSNAEVEVLDRLDFREFRLSLARTAAQRSPLVRSVTSAVIKGLTIRLLKTLRYSGPKDAMRYMLTLMRGSARS